MWRALTLVSIAGCWTEDVQLVDGTFTQSQWDMLQAEFLLPEPQTCPKELPDCGNAALLGQRLFYDAELSGPILIEDVQALGRRGDEGRVACASCHDPGNEKKGYFVDTRSSPGNISIGTDYTGHNALSLVNVAYKQGFLAESCRESSDPYCARGFSWTGQYENAARVLELAGLGRAAMNSSRERMATLVRTSRYVDVYTLAFGADPSGQTVVEIFDNLAIAFDSYIHRLISRNAPIDRYLAGEHDALSDGARRGLAVFIGKGMCVECHRGYLWSDLKFHNTGVPQLGPHVASPDLGLGGTGLDPDHPPDPRNGGKFLTPPLRHLSKTAPYMHAGQFSSINEVIRFYREGGATEGFSGEKDPRIQPLEIDDDEARDLEEFLRDALLGEPVDAALRGPV